MAPLQSLSRKQIKTKLMLCEPLRIICVRVKGPFKVILQYKNEAPHLQMAHALRDFINAKFQVSVQINEVQLYNKNKTN